MCFQNSDIAYTPVFPKYPCVQSACQPQGKASNIFNIHLYVIALYVIALGAMCIRPPCLAIQQPLPQDSYPQNAEIELN